MFLPTRFLGGVVQEQLGEEGSRGAVCACVCARGGCGQSGGCQGRRKNPSKASSSFSKTQSGGATLPLALAIGLFPWVGSPETELRWGFGCR